MNFDFREWYSQAHTLLFQLRTAQHWRLTCEPRTVLEDDNTPENLAKAEKLAISDARIRAKAVQGHLALVRSLEADLDEGINILWPMLMPAYVEFRDLEVENLPPSRCAWGVMKSLIEFLDWHWAGPLLRLVESEIPYLSAKDSIRWFNEECWLLRIIDPIHARLTLEESWLLKNTAPLVSLETKVGMPNEPTSNCKGGRPAETTSERALQVEMWWRKFQQEPEPQGYQRNKRYRKRSTDDFIDLGKFMELPNFPSSKEEVERCKKRYRDLHPKKSAKTKPPKRH